MCHPRTFCKIQGACNCCLVLVSRRLEDCSKQQVKCDGAIEFLYLCQNFELTPTFAKVDQTKSKKWSKASEQLSTNVMREELRSKLKQKATLKDVVGVGKHGLETIGDLTNNFSVLKKCNGKLNCLIYEMFFIKKIRPCLNTQSDSLRAKLFI